MISPIKKEIRNKIGESVSIGILGDISFHNINMLDKSIFSPLLDIIQETDIVIANIETVISDRAFTNIKKKGLLLKSPASTAKVLKEIGINVGLLANNHINDYGIEGINDTIINLEKEKIFTFGLPNKNPLQVIKKNLAFDFYGFVPPHYDSDNLLSYGNKINQIYPLSKSENHIIYFLHGFDELFSIPFPWRVNLLKQLSKIVNPSAVICGHQHIYQGYIINNGIPICLSYGNGFINIDYHKSNVDSLIGCFSVLQFDSIGCYEINEYYYEISKNIITQLTDDKFEYIVSTMTKKMQIISDEKQLEKAWENECYTYYNKNRFTRNIILNLMYDIYRFFIFRKKFQYIHYRLMFFSYLKVKWFNLRKI